MLHFPSSPLPVLVIEDNDAHFDAIRGVLTESSDCTVDRQTTHNEEELYNYKSAHPDSQLVIVDLELGQRRTQGHEGLEIVEFLQKADRTTFYIIYTRHNIPEEMSRDMPGPHWTYARKECLPNGALTAASLEQLRNVTEEYKEWCAPVLDEPEYDTFHFNRELIEYTRNNGVLGVKEITQYATNSVDGSVTVLRTLVRAASIYNRAGRRTERLAIGVFGSCGRMEMRADSDIEVTVLFEPTTPSKPMRELSAILWNRITRRIASSGWEYEGKRYLEKNTLRYRHADLIQEGVPAQGYLFAIDIDGLIQSDLTKAQHVRHRHLQILTELRPVF